MLSLQNAQELSRVLMVSNEQDPKTKALQFRIVSLSFITSPLMSQLERFIVTSSAEIQW